MPDIGLYEGMRTLRAVRRLRSDPIPDDVLHRVLEAATWAPTGGNRQPWRIIVVKDRARKEKLATLYQAVWAEFIKGYQRLLDAVQEPDVRERNARMIRAATHLADHYADSPIILIFCFNPEQLAVTDEKLDRVSVVGGGSVYPAVQNVLLACRAEGLGCTLTTLLCARDPEVCELLSIPKPWGTAAAIPIGYPVHRGHGPLTRRPVAEMVYTDSWGKQ